MNKILVSEIFFSLNGEGLEIGKPTVFVRLSGCNLECSWCDTRYANDNPKEMSAMEIIKEIKKVNNGSDTVLITGGEPLTQDIENLVSLLTEKEYQISIETNGSIYRDILLDFDFISVDVKTPSSFNETYDLDTFKKIVNVIKIKGGQIKAVIADEKDYHFLKKFIEENSFNIPVIIQPCWGRITYKKLCEIYLSNPINHGDIRILLQIHKIGEYK